MPVLKKYKSCLSYKLVVLKVPPKKDVLKFDCLLKIGESKHLATRYVWLFNEVPKGMHIKWKLSREAISTLDTKIKLHTHTSHLLYYTYSVFSGYISFYFTDSDLGWVDSKSYIIPVFRSKCNNVKGVSLTFDCEFRR